MRRFWFLSLFFIISVLFAQEVKPPSMDSVQELFTHNYWGDIVSYYARNFYFNAGDRKLTVSFYIENNIPRRRLNTQMIEYSFSPSGFYLQLNGDFYDQVAQEAQELLVYAATGLAATAAVGIITSALEVAGVKMGGPADVFNIGGSIARYDEWKKNIAKDVVSGYRDMLKLRSFNDEAEVNRFSEVYQATVEKMNREMGRGHLPLMEVLLNTRATASYGRLTDLLMAEVGCSTAPQLIDSFIAFLKFVDYRENDRSYLAPSQVLSVWQKFQTELAVLLLRNADTLEYRLDKTILDTAANLLEKEYPATGKGSKLQELRSMYARALQKNDVKTQRELVARMSSMLSGAGIYNKLVSHYFSIVRQDLVRLRKIFDFTGPEAIKYPSTTDEMEDYITAKNFVLKNIDDYLEVLDTIVGDMTKKLS